MEWARLAASQAGVITREQLRAAGVADDRTDRLVASGALVPVTPGVFVVRGAPATYDHRLWTAVLAIGGLIGFGTAAYLWALIDLPPARIDVVIPHARRVAIPSGVRVHRVAVADVAIVQQDGLPLTNRTWTALDHLGRLPSREAYRFADRALQRHWITPQDIAERLRTLRGRQGNGMLRRVAAHCGDGAAAESERLLHRLLRGAGIRGWVANHPIRQGGHVIAVVDVAMREARLAIEVDGWAYHSDIDRFQRDRRRQNALTLRGWRVLRFTWVDLVDRPAYVIATIRAELARAG